MPIITSCSRPRGFVISGTLPPFPELPSGKGDHRERQREPLERVALVGRRTADIRLPSPLETRVRILAEHSDLDREEAYMLLGIIGELRVGTSPRPVMAARLIVPLDVLSHAGWRGLS